MRTLASFLMVSLDGYFEAADPEDFGWQTVDEEFNQFAVQQLDASECLLFGRVTSRGWRRTGQPGTQSRTIRRWRRG